MVTPIEKRSSNKFCEFHNDKGHNTDECVQLRKQIEELVRAGKLSHFIKEIKRDRDQQKTGQKDAPVKDKATTIAESDMIEGDTEFPPLAAHKGTGTPLVIEAKKSGHAVHRIYVDRGSSMEVLYEHCFNRLRPKIKTQMVPTTTSLTDFSRETLWPLGQLRLLVTIGDVEHYTRVWMNFMIVRSPSAYNGIIRRPEIREIQAVPSTAHEILKFLVKGRIVTIRSIILTPTECTTIAATSKDHAKKAEIRYDNFKVAIHPDFPDQEITIGGTMSIKARTKLFTLLKKNLDIFAWQPSDMTGVPRSITEHRLNIQERYSPHDGSWRMCMDFTNLNKACPHDCYPFQKSIRRSNPSAATPLSVSWMLTKAIIKYKWPNKMKKRRLSTPVTGYLEMYVDDMVIKSHTETKLLQDIEETFRTLRRKIFSTLQNIEEVHKKSDFHWTPDAKQAFKQLKQHIARLPMMRYSPNTGLFCKPSTADSRAKLTPMEKLVLALVCTAKRLRRYFQAYPIVVITDQPIKQTSVKGQILADFLVEKPDDAPPKASVIERAKFTYALRFQFTASSNEAKYEALIAGLRIAAQMGVRNVHVLVEVVKEKSIQEEVATIVEEEGPTWMTPIMEYLKDGTLPSDRKEASKLRIKARYMYTGPRSVVAKAMRLGYYWPTMHRDVRDMNTCNAYQWGISIASPWKDRKGQVFDNRYGLFHKVDRSEIRGNNYRWSGEEVRVGQHSMPFRSPRRNSLGQRNQGSPWRGKQELDKRASPCPLGPSYNDQIKHGDTPFSLTYGMEAVIPAEIRMTTYRTAIVDAVHNNKEIRLNLDLLEERRECAAIHEAKVKLKMTKYYNSWVRGVTFRPGDFVYRSNGASHAMDEGKLGSK
nr:hypothetical protein [Tanacetum cinerariifolium]